MENPITHQPINQFYGQPTSANVGSFHNPQASLVSTLKQLLNFNLTILL